MNADETADILWAEERLIEEMEVLLGSLGVGTSTDTPAAGAYHRYRIASEQFDRVARSLVDREVSG